jgi:hypothetical protein
MRRDVQLLVPLLISGLGFGAVAVGLFLLTGLKWDVALEDVGLAEPPGRTHNVSLPTAIPAIISWQESTQTPTSEPTATEVTLERRPHDPNIRTGVEDVDRVIDLVLGVDDNAIRDTIDFTIARCTHADGLGGPPKCKGGEYEGTRVEVLPILGPEGHHYRKDEIDDWRGIGVVGLYAAYEVSGDAFSDENYPAGEYAAIFMESDHQFLVLQIVNRGIVRVDYVLGEEPEAKIEREARRVILAPLPHGVIPSTGLGLTVPGWSISPTNTPSGGYGTLASKPAATQAPSTTSEQTPEFANLILTRYPYLRKSQIVFPKGTPYIYAVWDYKGMQEGMVVRLEWYRHGELWLEQEELWDFEKYGSSGTMFDISIYNFVDGIDPGLYVLDLYVDDVHVIGSGYFQVWSRSYSVKPQASPDGNYIARVEPPGMILLQKWGKKERELLTVDEIASLAWFPGSGHLLYVNVNRFAQDEFENMKLGFETWIVDIKTGDRKMIASTAHALRMGKPSPGGRYVVGISGSGWADACNIDSYLIVLRLDRDHNRIATYRLEDFSGGGRDFSKDGWDIHPGNIQWVSRYQFTAELQAACLPPFDAEVYIFDLKTMKATKVGSLENESVWSY